MPDLKPYAIATGVGETEGPVVRADGEVIVTSMDQGVLYSIRDEKTTLFCDLGHFPNGCAEGSDGTIYVTQAGMDRWGKGKGDGGIQAVAKDGTWRWTTRDPITPNDLCFGPDGLLYITDPTRPRPARDDGRLFRCDVTTGETELLCTLPWYPNGIGFGLEDDAVYVMNTPTHQIMRLPLSGGKLGKPEVFIQQSKSHRGDGFAFDVEGNCVVGCNALGDERGQVQTFDRNGKLIDTFVPSPDKGKRVCNVALSPDRRLIACTSDVDTVYEIDNWPTAGLLLHPFRTG